MKSSVLQSRRFWAALIDAIVSLILLIVGHYLPTEAEFIKAIVLSLQPVFIALIAAYTVEDSIIAAKQ